MINNRINFAWPITAERADVFRFFNTEAERLKDTLSSGRIVIFGAGIRGCCLLLVLQQHGYKDFVFCDNNPEKQGNCIECYDILPLQKVMEFPGKQVFVISPENSGSIRRQLTLAGLQEEKDWFSFDFPVYNSYVDEYSRSLENYLLVMGDCGFSHVAITDNNTESLGDMIKARFGRNNCKVLAMHGIGQQANYHILHTIIDKGENPKALLLLLALETLTPKAHLMPRTQHPALIQSLAETEASPASELCEYAKLANERFQHLQVELFAENKKKRDENSEKLYMQMNYMFKLREDTEGVIYLKKTIQMMNRQRIPVVLYIPPVNHKLGESLFGTLFNERYQDNFQSLFKILDSSGLKYDVIDASFLLNDNQIAAKNTIDESANYMGRCKLLDFISNSSYLTSIFKDK